MIDYVHNSKWVIRIIFMFTLDHIFSSGQFKYRFMGSLTVLHNHRGQPFFKNRIDTNCYYYDWYKLKINCQYKLI